MSIALMPFAAPDPMFDVNDEPEADLSGAFMAKFGEKVYDNYGMGALIRGGAPAKQLSHEQKETGLDAMLRLALDTAIEG